MTRPLHPIAPATAPKRGGGCWGAVVQSVNPAGAYTCSVPALTGTLMGQGGMLAVPFDPVLAVGDRVWVMPIEGNPDRLLIFARRSA